MALGIEEWGEGEERSMRVIPARTLAIGVCILCAGCA